VTSLCEYIKKNAKIDIHANKANSAIIKRMQRKLSSMKILQVFTSIFLNLFIIGAVLCYILLHNLVSTILCGIGAIASIALLIILHCKKKAHKKAVDSYIQIGYKQMMKVNGCITSSTLAKMVSNACTP
jgi:ABC-type iron transport system FetAB permease component